nr:hypothetical protein CFP56_09277 [Quercus suber]
MAGNNVDGHSSGIIGFGPSPSDPRSTQRACFAHQCQPLRCHISIDHGRDIADKRLPRFPKLGIAIEIRDIHSRNTILLPGQNGLSIALKRRRISCVAIDYKRRLLRITAIAIKPADVRRIVHGLAVLEHVDVICDAPVRLVDGGARVEEYGIATSERLLGGGRGVAHVGDARPVRRSFVEEDAVDVDVLLVVLRTACRWPVLVFGDVVPECAQRLRAGADVVAIRPTVVLVCRVHVGKRLDIRDAVQVRGSVHIVAVGTRGTPGAVVWVYDGLEGHVWIVLRGSEERIPCAGRRIYV